MPHTKGGRLFRQDFEYFQNLSEQAKIKKALEFYETILQLIARAPQVENLYVSIGMTRARTKFATILKVNGLQYGGYHESFDQSATEFIRKVQRYFAGGTDDFNHSQFDFDIYGETTDIEPEPEDSYGEAAEPTGGDGEIPF